jgi:uncharacterized membrane protein
MMNEETIMRKQCSNGEFRNCSFGFDLTFWFFNPVVSLALGATVDAITAAESASAGYNWEFQLTTP